MTRKGWRRALFGLALVSASLSGASAERDAPGSAWFPLEPGARARFDVHRDRLVRPVGGAPLRTLWIGRADESVQRQGARILLRADARESLVERGGIGVGGAPVRTVDLDEYSVEDGALLLHRRVREAGEASEETDYDPPLRVLAASVASGSRWKVGTLTQGELRIAIEAEATGREALALSGGRRLEDTLRVAYRGTIRSRGGAAQGPAVGRYERDAWFARDLGLVRETIRIELEQGEGEDAATVVETLRRVRALPGAS